MEKKFDYTEIRPYTDSEVHSAFERVCGEPEFKNVIKQIFPDIPLDVITERLLSINTVYEFQHEIMAKYFMDMAAASANGVSINGLAKITPERKHLFISNHRDIIIDAGLLNVLMAQEGLPTSENAMGDNLCTRQWITDIMRLNKNFMVKRSGTKREIFDSSMRLSAYMRSKITANESSIWIAQREGRAKDSNDRTQESLLKMLNMSSTNLKQGFMEMHIMPVSISYEYDACDFLKAKEFQQKRDDAEFKKSAYDDIVNMRTGLTEYKGHIHYELSDCISPVIAKEVDEADDRATVIEKVAKIIDRKIHAGYKFYAGNFVAYDERFGTDRFAHKYSTIEKNTFDEYIEQQIEKIDLEERDDEFLRAKMLEMYSNPLVNYLEAVELGEKPNPEV